MLLLGILFVAVVVSLRMGAYPISVREIVATLVNGALGRRDQIPSEFWLVVFGLRLPRIALGILVGAALSTSGAGFQALLRNPLADPYVLGVSSGAALGAIISLIAAPFTPGMIQVGAFVGAAATITAVYFLGRRGGQVGYVDAAAGGNYFGVVFFGGDHVFDDHDERARPARHGVLVDGRSVVVASGGFEMAVPAAADWGGVDLHDVV